MADLVERLRGPTYPGWRDERADISRSEAHEAADEIERLRESEEALRQGQNAQRDEIERLRDLLSDQRDEHALKAKAEIERLRALSNDPTYTIKLPGKWSLRKQVLADESVWALQYNSMDWIKVTEFLPAKPSDPPSARGWLDNEMRKFAAAMNGESDERHR